MCDPDYEVYTIRADSVLCATANNNFVSYINIPLRNVVRAEVLTINVGTNSQIASSNVAYMHVSELVSKFIDHSDLKYTIGAAGRTDSQGVGGVTQNMSYVRNSIICFPLDIDANRARSIYTINGSGFPTDITFVEPIRQLKTLSISLWNEQGVPLVVGESPTFVTFRFTCAKRNICNY
jgi:hypothetical protein